jgi:hypothetical protein
MKTQNTIIALALFFISFNGFSQVIGTGFPDRATDFSVPLKSGVYNGLSAAGRAPDDSYGGWQHLFVTRHENATNNFQLQLASSFAKNDKLFFRKIENNLVGTESNGWFELATRGANNFIGNQAINGNLSIGKDTEVATISGPTNSGAIQIKSHSALGGSANRYLRLGWKDGLNNFSPALSINDDLNVGIGTTTPMAKLDVYTPTPQVGAYNSQTWSTVNPMYNLQLKTIWGNDGLNYQFVQKYNNIEYPSLSFYTDGKVGIGTQTSAKLHVTAPASGTPIDAMIVDVTSFGTPTNAIASSFFKVRDIGANNNTPFMIRGDGNVGIGTNAPDAKLTVNGQIHTKEVRIDLIAPMVPDYVFANDYKLKTLNEVDQYVKANSHLPEIPSAAAMAQNGMLVSEMNLSLLKKIEELTLYAIEQQKKLEAQNKDIEVLKAQNKQLESLSERLSKLEKK